MIEIRFHGRGGQGARAASRIVGRAGFLAGLYAQDFPLFGAERRGAPIVACTRLSHEPIESRGYVEEPHLLVVLDASLVKEAAAQIFHGIRAGTPILINTHTKEVKPPVEGLPLLISISLDLTAVSLCRVGRKALSAVVAGAVAKFVPEITSDILDEAIRVELTEIGIPAEFIERNVQAAREAYARMPSFFLPERRPGETKKIETVKAFPLPFFNADLAALTIRQPGNAALRQTGRWRLERPEIDLGKCKRCFLCFLFCPDTAILLDEENYPHIDYEHCKGCMICYEECPPRAIARRPEEASHGA